METALFLQAFGPCQHDRLNGAGGDALSETKAHPQSSPSLHNGVGIGQAVSVSDAAGGVRSWERDDQNWPVLAVCQLDGDRTDE